MLANYLSVRGDVLEYHVIYGLLINHIDWYYHVTHTHTHSHEQSAFGWLEWTSDRHYTHIWFSYDSVVHLMSSRERRRCLTLANNYGLLAKQTRISDVYSNQFEPRNMATHLVVIWPHHQTHQLGTHMHNHICTHTLTHLRCSCALWWTFNLPLTSITKMTIFSYTNCDKLK